MRHQPGNPRSLLLAWASRALAAVDPRRRVADALGDFPRQRVAVLALGKAAVAMSAGATDALGARVARGLIIAPQPATLPHHWEFQAGDHPVPGTNSLAAGSRIATWLAALDEDLPLLVLLSGGGSALAELPVAGMTLADLQRLNSWLLGSGLDIGRINAIRGRFSRLKQGGLLQLAGARAVSALLVADVPGDDPAVIASGPLCPQRASWPDVPLPGWLADLNAKLPLPARSAALAPATLRIVARNADALDALAKEIRTSGHTLLTRGVLLGEAREAGVRIARQLREGPPGIHLFGGETVVRLPGNPGRGGRNQHLALAAAREIAGCDAFLLALATDGIDGNSEDAGALVDGGTLQRIADAGLFADEHLGNADSNTALAASGDVIHTGPTGTNVMDLVVAWKR